MELLSVKIKGFRNFEDSNIFLNKESLIMGPNDVGKTNLLYALRLLFDRSLSQEDMSPKDTDFNLFNDSNSFSIVARFGKFDLVVDEKIISKFGTYRSSETGELYIGYKANKNSEEPFNFYIGDNCEIVNNENCKIDGRTYLNCINMAYLDSSRSLRTYLRTSKNRMIVRYKNNRTQDQIEADNQVRNDALENLLNANNSIEKISYIKDSANFISKRITDFNIGNNSVALSTLNSLDDLEKNVELVSIVGGKKVEIGGDGKSNEIYLIMWIEEQIIQAKERNSWLFFAIEEPENHLFFPLQNRIVTKVKEYLSDYQFIVSTHSPVVFNAFNPSSIVRIQMNKEHRSYVVNDGCSKDLIEPFYTFGFRHNVMTNEMFFANQVLLVEGVSEKLFYSSLSKVNDDLLDKTNTRIIVVDGVGFPVYIKILKTLDIKYVVRTDNDFLPVKYGTGRKKTKYCAIGLLRLINIYRENNLGNFIFDDSLFKDLKNCRIPRKLRSIFNQYKNELEKVNLFLSKVDLEYDIFYSPLKCAITRFYFSKGITDTCKFLDEMRRSKGNNMFELLQSIDDSQLKLIDKKTEVGRPLFMACGEWSQ